jgi:hypothetical protein
MHIHIPIIRLGAIEPELPTGSDLVIPLYAVHSSCWSAMALFFHQPLKVVKNDQQQCTAAFPSRSGTHGSH